MSGFGDWMEERKAAESGESPRGSWAMNSMGIDVSGSMEQLPLFNSETMQSMSFSNMKAAMEGQMPKKIMGMGYQQRFKVFCGLLFLSALFFALAFFVGLPAIALRPQKFALSFTIGSLTFMGSFGILKGPMEHLKSMLQPDQLVFTFFYLGSMFLTLLFTFKTGGVKGYVLVLSASAVQLLALVSYLISFIPGGAAGLKYVFAAMGHILQPVFTACARFQAICLAKCFSWITQSGATSP